MTQEPIETITVREATQADVPTLGRFGALLVSLHHGWDPHRFIDATPRTSTEYAGFFERLLGRDGVTILVAVDGLEVLGYVYMASEGYNYMALRGPSAVIQDLFVAPDRRRRGIGKSLLLAARNEASRQGQSQLTLSTAFKNEAAQRLFASLGFRPTMIEMTQDLSP
jgi:ribosomal protein S18 acetylase RimI-like enzyme